MEIWNMRFDIQYLYYRIQMLGYNPASIMCHPDFENPKCAYEKISIIDCCGETFKPKVIVVNKYQKAEREISSLMLISIKKV